MSLNSKPILSIIAALGTRTRALGKDNDLLFRIPGDLPRVKELTMGHPLVMGKKTFESIGRPLPGRTNIVVTHNTDWQHEGVTVCHSLEEALAAAKAIDTEEVFIFGGGSLYAQTIEHADRLYLTLVDDDTPGDTFFPDYTTLPFKEVSREEHTADDFSYAYVILERATGAR